MTCIVPLSIPLSHHRTAADDRRIPTRPLLAQLAQNRHPRVAESMGYPKSRHYTLEQNSRSSADGEPWEGWFGEAHPLRQGNPEPVEQCGLSGIGLGYAAQTNLAVSCGGQHDIVRLNACEFVEHGARGIAQTGALLPHL